jgi:ADP-ribosylglycohydrolase
LKEFQQAIYHSDQGQEEHPMTTPRTVADWVTGAMLGKAIGDALGVPVEFRSRDALRRDPVSGMRAFGTHHQPAGIWSDDTSLALCLAESLCETGIDFFDQADRFVRWRRLGYWTPRGEVFDIGGATARAICRLEEGVEPTEAGPAGESDCGNGSLMRILPLALFLAYADASYRAETVIGG